jgi:tRNA pseudouridine32 synthase/23S rRNA pseudouridine746 synthase
VLDKPSGLLSVPGRGPENQDNLTSRVQLVHPTARVIHRLDRDTSGILLLALDEAAQSQLARQFQERLVEKLYTAIAAGRPSAEHGLIELPLAKDFSRPPTHHVDPVHGRMAVTQWRVVEQFADRARLELRPLTGRSHQLRVHLQHIGHPILGDNLYAPQEVRAMADRLQLHAEQLTVMHPGSGERITWRCTCPF